MTDFDNHNPYQTPQSNLNQDYDDEIPPLYNPNAVALWSLLFTPFGAWMHAKNWEAVGEYELARQNRLFAFVVVALIVGSILVEMLFGFAIPSLSVSLIPLLVWYRTLGKQQIDLVKEELGSDYEKRSLVVPVLVGVIGGVLAVVVIAIIMHVMLGALDLLHPAYLAE
ncbi:hypothetical protein [Moraxella oblonga]|uniref:hypothetical protein n=1 Tax=Moraxella oblonga TaxID=200413 RepID=UPI0008332CEC|nr:hypothetical protein [Moraxella oblonga]